MDKKDDNQELQNPLISHSGDSLEYSDDPATGASASTPENSGEETTNAESRGSKSTITVLKPMTLFHRIWSKFNVYLLIFLLLILIAGASTFVLYIKSKQGDKSSSTTDTITPQKLSTENLQQLANNGVQVGDPKQILSIQSNSVFAGTVLVKGELQVAGGLKIGSGSLAIPDVDIGGTALINQLQAKSIAVSGNASVQGQLSVQQNLNVNGAGSFNGPLTTPQLTTGRLQISGDLAITRHFIAGGSIPKRANGNLGNGGTSSVSGSDTAGSVTINTGSGAGAGCLVTITFASAFNSTPHISLTPVGSAAAGIQYYIDRTASSFSICSASAPPSNANFGFDYLVMD